MREKKGKLIAVWNPFFHREGGSTITVCLGCMLNLYAHKTTLIVDAANSNSMIEHSLKNDVEIKYTIDSIAPIGKSLILEDIKTYATAINDKIAFLAGAKMDDASVKHIIPTFIEEATGGYDYVVIDINSGLNNETRVVLDNADLIVATMSIDVINYLDKTENKEILEYIKADKTICAFNKIPGEAIKIVDEYIKDTLKDILKVENIVNIPMDAGIFYASCIEKKAYSYIFDNILKNGNDFMNAIQDIAFMTITRFDKELAEFGFHKKRTFVGKLMERIL